MTKKQSQIKAIKSFRFEMGLRNKAKFKAIKSFRIESSKKTKPFGQ